MPAPLLLVALLVGSQDARCTRRSATSLPNDASPKWWTNDVLGADEPVAGLARPLGVVVVLEQADLEALVERPEAL